MRFVFPFVFHPDTTKLDNRSTAPYIVGAAFRLLRLTQRSGVDHLVMEKGDSRKRFVAKRPLYTSTSIADGLSRPSAKFKKESPHYEHTVY